ncbi:hypothetical protein BGX34_010282 [Mortierella sp. NVP85]|nr:hypothetical protein BGX34_010282 [Mortierella sp. NVP85]
MPSTARPIAHRKASAPAPQGQGHAVDPAFTAPDFDVKNWINALFSSVPTHQDDSTPSTGPTASASLSSSGPSSVRKLSISSTSLDSADASLDASLDLLQTPALDPVLGDGKGPADQDSLSGSGSIATLPTTTGQQQQQPSTLANASKSRSTLLTHHATTHLTKLHLFASQTSAALASTTQDVVKLLPRLTHELDQLRQETRTLQEGIRLVRDDINSVDSSDTVQALDRLKYLDLVKTRMEATHAALREAENWRNLESEANDILAKGDFMRAATRLSEAERSLVVYKNTNVEGDRMELLLDLKSQLEQQVMGKVKEALEQKDTAACQTFINVFALIGRQERFQEYYIAQRRTPLLEQWRTLTAAMNISARATTTVATRSQGSASGSKDFVNVLQTFYKDASNILHDEFAWISSIFADPVATIHNLVRDIFSHMDPNIQAALQHVIKTQGDEASLPTLIAAFTATESFGTRMERIVSQPLVGNQREGNRPRSGILTLDSGSKDGKGGHLGRSTTGEDSLELGSIHDPNEWAYILYEPFMAYQRDYGKLEEAHLRALLAKAVPSMASYSDPATKSREIAKSSSHLIKIMTNTNNLAFNLAEGAIGRCMRLTHGFGVPGLLDGLNGFFQDIMDRYIEILVECRRRSGLQVDEPTGNRSKQLDLGRSSPRPGGKYGSAHEEEDEDSEGWDEDTEEQDQRRLLMGLRLMVLCRQFCLKLEQLSTRTKKALRGVEELIKTDRTTLDQSQSALEHGTAGSGLKPSSHQQPPNASLALLQQSNLNSFRLLEVLELVKKSDPKEEQALNAGLAGDGGLDRHGSIELDMGLEPRANHLFLQSHQRAVHLTKLCQRFIFDFVYVPLARPLADLALLPCWTEGIDQSGQGDDAKGARRIHQSTLGGTRTDVIKFRSNPNDYMEDLLRQLNGLPFGTYEGDLGLRFGVHSLPYADRPLVLAQHQSHQESTEQQSSSLTAGTEDGGGVGLGVGEAAEHGTTKDEHLPQGLEELMAEEDDVVVLHRWITSVSRAIMHTIIERLYNPHWGQTKAPLETSAPTTTSTPPPSTSRSRFGLGSSSLLPSATSSPTSGPVNTTGASHSSKERYYLTRLSESGAKQLELDLGYFVDTYLDSLGIEPTPSFRSLIKALRLSESGMSLALQQVKLQQEELQKHHQQGSEGPSTNTQQHDHDSPQQQRPQPQVSVVIPGAPVLPSVLVVAEDDLIGQLEVEQKILEWVARLKGMDISTA